MASETETPKKDSESVRLADEKWKSSDSFRLIQRLRKEQVEVAEKSKATRADAMMETPCASTRSLTESSSDEGDEKAFQPLTTLLSSPCMFFFL
jgi:hypothetical protein